VDIQTGMRLGKDFTLSSLRDEGYEAVFLAVGAPQGTTLGVPGEDLEGVDDAIRFLREYNVRGSARVGRKVAVVGGGNAAVDAARTAIRLGAESVTILYRRSRDEMPAYTEEIEEAEHEGVVLKVLVAPVEILGKDGCAAGVKCRAMVLGDFDRSGRRRPVEMSSGEFVEEADQVIVAIGQACDAGSLCNGVDLKLTRSKFIETNPVNGQTSAPWIFAGGDVSTGPASVAEAVGGGERAAIGMDEMLTGAKHAFWRSERDVKTAFDPEADPVQYARAQMQLIPVARRRQNFSEVEQPFSPQDALREAKRCLRCDYRAKE
jgi:NADH-quinone oxidoreductase subunit F